MLCLCKLSLVQVTYRAECFQHLSLPPVLDVEQPPAKASKPQRDLHQLAALEAHDQHVARWLNEVSEDQWDNHGDQLEQPISTSKLADTHASEVQLLFDGHVQGSNSGH